MTTESKTSARKIKTAERRSAAVSYRLGGKNYEEIGTLLEISKQAAHKLVVTALAEISEQTSENAEQLRLLELERLNFMRNALWSQVMKGDIQAINAGIKLSESIRKLQGLDAPAKTDITSGGNAIAPRIEIIMPDDKSTS